MGTVAAGRSALAGSCARRASCASAAPVIADRLQSPSHTGRLAARLLADDLDGDQSGVTRCSNGIEVLDPRLGSQFLRARAHVNHRSIDRGASPATDDRSCRGSYIRGKHGLAGARVVEPRCVGGDLRMAHRLLSAIMRSPGEGPLAWRRARPRGHRVSAKPHQEPGREPDRETDLEQLLERLKSLRTVVPVFAQELASTRRQEARLRAEDTRLLERVRHLQSQRGRGTSLGQGTSPGAVPARRDEPRTTTPG